MPPSGRPPTTEMRISTGAGAAAVVAGGASAVVAAGVVACVAAGVVDSSSPPPPQPAAENGGGRECCAQVRFHACLPSPSFRRAGARRRRAYAAGGPRRGRPRRWRGRAGSTAATAAGSSTGGAVSPRGRVRLRQRLRHVQEGAGDEVRREGERELEGEPEQEHRPGHEEGELAGVDESFDVLLDGEASESDGGERPRGGRTAAAGGEPRAERGEHAQAGEQLRQVREIAVNAFAARTEQPVGGFVRPQRAYRGERDDGRPGETATHHGEIMPRRAAAPSVDVLAGHLLH